MANIEEIRRRIDNLIAEKGFNYRDVSLKIGRKDSYMQQYVKYGYPRRLKEIDRLRLAKLLNIDDTEIMDDEVIASKTFGSSPEKFDLISDIIKASETPEGDLIKLDVLSNQFDAQEPEKFLINTSGKHLISRNILEEITDAKPSNIKIVKITNDSMKPFINPGDTIWFDISYTYPEADGLYLLSAGRELMVKRIQISPLDGTVEINSDNPSYKTYHAPHAQDVKVLGKLICHMQKI